MPCLRLVQNFFITISRHLKWTGFKSMKDKSLLIATQDRVWDSGSYMPRTTNGNEITFCNEAVNAVLVPMGCSEMVGMMADEMVLYMRTSKTFLQKPIEDCQFLANEGVIIVAGLTSRDLKQDHGHVATLTPGQGDYSGHWNKKTPVCLSLGRPGICFRSRGVNYAFVQQPDFFAWIPSL